MFMEVFQKNGRHCESCLVKGVLSPRLGYLLRELLLKKFPFIDSHISEGKLRSLRVEIFITSLIFKYLYVMRDLRVERRQWQGLTVTCTLSFVDCNGNSNTQNKRYQSYVWCLAMGRISY